MRENINSQLLSATRAAMDENLHSPQRRLIELRMEHADLDDLIDRNVLERRRPTSWRCAA